MRVGLVTSVLQERILDGLVNARALKVDSTCNMGQRYWNYLV